MQIQSKKLSDTKVSLSVSASHDELAAIKNRVLGRLAKTRVNVAGFRKGKAPLALVEKQLDFGFLQSEFLEEAASTLMQKAIEQAGLRPVDYPKVDVKKFVPFDTLDFDAEFEVVGDIVLADYKKIRLAQTPVKVTGKDVSGIIDSLRQREAVKKPVQRTAKKGDSVLIDSKGTDNKTKEPVKGAEGNNYPLTLGSNSFIAGFEDELIGQKAGGQKTFTLTFPKDYGVRALQNRKVTFEVTIREVNELELPALDDKFAAKIGPFKTLDELKNEVKTQLTAEKQRDADLQYENDLITKVTEASKVAAPESLINQQLDKIAQEEKQNALYRGQTWAEYLSAEGLSEENYRADRRKAAELRVKAGLVLTEIAIKENVQVTNDELIQRLQALRQQYTDARMQAELDKPDSQREVANRMLTEKTIALLVGFAAAKK